MRAFIILRKYALGYAALNRKLEEFTVETNMQFSDIYQSLTERKSVADVTLSEALLKDSSASDVNLKIIVEIISYVLYR